MNELDEMTITVVFDHGGVLGYLLPYPTQHLPCALKTMANRLEWGDSLEMVVWVNWP